MHETFRCHADLELFFWHYNVKHSLKKVLEGHRAAGAFNAENVETM